MNTNESDEMNSEATNRPRPLLEVVADVVANYQGINIIDNMDPDLLDELTEAYKREVEGKA